MNVELKITADGSHTLYVPGLNEHYHSTFGAINESLHVFIESGFSTAAPTFEVVRLLEVGFGTGLNALLTWMESERIPKKVRYTALEPYPLGEAVWSSLNYPDCFCTFDYTPFFTQLHKSGWDEGVQISPFFHLLKIRKKLEVLIPGKETYNLVYFDAFGPEVQPELWSEGNFRKIFQSMEEGGILVTYSVKGSVRRALSNAGFKVEKIPGPAGKREITRAIKNGN